MIARVVWRHTRDIAVTKYMDTIKFSIPLHFENDILGSLVSAVKKDGFVDVTFAIKHEDEQLTPGPRATPDILTTK